MDNEFINVWNHSHKKHFKGEIIYDDWLTRVPFANIINNETGLFMDLGCGQGNNTKFLIEKNKNVISCDLSNEALKIVSENIPGSNVIQLDMSKKFDFKDNTFNIIISDFSLQYFSKDLTFQIIMELARILKNNGYCILRLSSINDTNYGALQGEYIEKNYYFVEKRKKRYFDEQDIREFFRDWDILYLKEKTEKLQRYEYERSFYEVLVRVRK